MSTEKQRTSVQPRGLQVEHSLELQLVKKEFGGPGVCRGPVSALDEVTELVESGKMVREALAGLTGL